MKDDINYSPSDCFETFPFPEHWETRPDLEAAGRAYHDFRAALLIENDEGLTRTYNRFHDPIGPELSHGTTFFAGPHCNCVIECRQERPCTPSTARMCCFSWAVSQPTVTGYRKRRRFCGNGGMAP